MSKISILEDNENKIIIISHIALFKKKIRDKPSNTVNKSDVLCFVDSIQKCI